VTDTLLAQLNEKSKEKPANMLLAKRLSDGLKERITEK